MEISLALDTRESNLKELRKMVDAKHGETEVDDCQAGLEISAARKRDYTAAAAIEARRTTGCKAGSIAVC
jgi:hypothetical protein